MELHARLATLVFLLAGCASPPPEGTPEYIRYQKYLELRQYCIQAEFQDKAEEIHAGFYSAGAIAQACGDWARALSGSNR